MHSRRIFLLFAGLLITSGLFAQADERRQLYRHKIERYSRLSNTGNILIVTGTVVTGASAITIYRDLNKSNIDPYQATNDSDDMIRLAIIGAGLGIDMIIGGIIMKAVGSRKVRQYNEKLNNLSAGIYVTPDSKGIGLVYRF